MIVYVVTMYRYGDREKHSYVYGVFSDRGLAQRSGYDEEFVRGGKYKAEVTEWIINEPINNVFVGDSDHEHDDRIL